MQQAVPQAAATGGAGSTLTVLLLLAGLLVIVAIGVKLYDLKRKREAEAVHLQADGIAVARTEHDSLEVTGHVPTPEARERALRIIEQEARSLRPDVVIVDRMEIEPAVRAA